MPACPSRRARGAPIRDRRAAPRGMPHRQQRDSRARIACVARRRSIIPSMILIISLEISRRCSSKTQYIKSVPTRRGTRVRLVGSCQLAELLGSHAAQIMYPHSMPSTHSIEPSREQRANGARAHTPCATHHTHPRAQALPITPATPCSTLAASVARLSAHTPSQNPSCSKDPTPASRSRTATSSSSSSACQVRSRCVEAGTPSPGLPRRDCSITCS